MFVYLLLAALALLIYIKLIKPLDHWKTRGVKYVSPITSYRSMLGTLLQNVDFLAMLQDWHYKFPKERYYGFFQFSLPILVIRDVELVKDITIKDFDHFTDHQAFSSEDLDPLWSKNLFAKNGDSWRDMRSTLSPSFTGSKMRTMFSLIDDCARQMTNYFFEKDEETQSLEMRDMFTRYTNDVIATCAFGVSCDSFRDKDNEFYKKGVDVTDFSGLKGFRIMGYMLSPALMKFLGVKIIDEGAGNFFTKIIGDTVKLREERGVIRPDMIHLLMEARKQRDSGASRKESITTEDMTAQALIFFIAGFDTVSTLMMYAAYELTANREAQEKLLREVDKVLEECKGKVTYEALTKMKYLDMVLQETLRLWPPTMVTDRMCTKDYVIAPKQPGEKPLLVTKGTNIQIPVYSLQRDPQYFPNPNKFEPERFSEENKDTIEPGAYMPFGIGPRICIGNRFALMETKAIVFHLLSRFEFVPVKKTVIPVVLSKKHFNLEAEGGMWIGLKKRNVK